MRPNRVGLVDANWLRAAGAKKIPPSVLLAASAPAPAPTLPKKARRLYSDAKASDVSGPI
jgi:hypothetical protein